MIRLDYLTREKMAAHTPDKGTDSFEIGSIIGEGDRFDLPKA
jgi:hypothetical protein